MNHHYDNSPSRPQNSRGDSNPNVGYQESRGASGHTSGPVWEIDNTKVYPKDHPVPPEFAGIGVLGGRKIIQKADGNYYLGELAIPFSFSSAHGQQNQQPGASDKNWNRRPFPTASEGDHPAPNDSNRNAWRGSTAGHHKATFFKSSTNIVATGGHFAVYEGDFHNMAHEGPHRQASITFSTPRFNGSVHDGQQYQQPDTGYRAPSRSPSPVDVDNDNSAPNDDNGPFLGWETDGNGNRFFGRNASGFFINGGNFGSHVGGSYVHDADITRH